MLDVPYHFQLSSNQQFCILNVHDLLIAQHCNIFQELKYVGLYFIFQSPLNTFDKHPAM